MKSYNVRQLFFNYFILNLKEKNENYDVSFDF